MQNTIPNKGHILFAPKRITTNNHFRTMLTTPPSTSTEPPSPSSSSSSQVVMIMRNEPDPPGTPFPGFRPGNIVELRMKDFLTFSETLFLPGPRMNLILGPNGAGKSTIVSAVCIVFGGAPKLLGRNLDLGSFVKHGAHHAEIEVSLYDPKCTRYIKRVKRVFDSDGKGSFYIDGNKVRVNQLHAMIHDRYDIQLDNLSQFMPQERITEFTNLSNDELLEITVRSLGGEQKVKEFAELAKWDQTASSSQDALEAMMKAIEDLQTRLEETAGEVEACKEQKRLTEKVAIYKKYVPSLEAAALRNELLMGVQYMKDVEMKIEQLKEQLASADSGPVNRRKQELRAAKETEKETKMASKRRDDAANNLVSQMDGIVMKLDAKQKEIHDVEKKAKQHQKGIQAAEQKLEKAEEELAQQGDVKEMQLNQQIDQLKRSKDDMRERQLSATRQLDQVETEIEDVSRLIRHHNQRLKGIESVRDQRIQSLARQYQQPKLIDCARLVEEMRHANAFKGNVYGPVAAEIEVSNEYHQRIMESCLRGFLMTAFVAEYSCDSKLLIRECRRRFNGWTPDAITSPTTRDDRIDHQAISNQRPRRPVDERLKELGIDAVISDIFSAPSAVKAALNAQASLHDVHVGNRRAESEEAENALRREEGLMAWYTPTRRCNLVGSRYHSGPKNLTIDFQFEYVSGKTFNGRMDSAERERARLASLIRQDEERLSAAKQRLEVGRSEARGFKEQYDIITRELSQITERKRKRVGLQASVERMRNHVERLRERAASMDIASEKAALEAQIQRLERDADSEAKRVAEALKDLCRVMAQYDDARIARVQASHNLAAEEAKHSSLRDDIKDKERDLGDIKGQVEGLQEQRRAKKREAKSMFSEQQREQYKALFEEINTKHGHNVESLQNEIVELEGRAQGLTNDGDRVISEYNHRQAQLKKLNVTYAKKREEQETQQLRLRENKEAFLSWLRCGIEKMRVKFSSLYRRLGCSGDLEIINTESERVGDMSLQILVSYRDDVELRPISSSANSGGEKMCCTMLFCFSLLLEEERMPPFVFVDELNQGLDPENELKIMTIMFEDAEKDSAPQSFVVSPKLLLNLPFHSQTKTHIIFNGSVSKSDVVAPMPTD